jgi:6-phosphogluconolactonase
MLMGMGDDGHTASIFPDQMHLLNEERFAATATHPDSGQTRVTLTGPVICQSKWIVYLVTGEKKAEPTQEIFTGQLASVNYPTAHIEAKEGELTWYVDEGAAKELHG